MRGRAGTEQCGRWRWRRCCFSISRHSFSHTRLFPFTGKKLEIYVQCAEGKHDRDANLVRPGHLQAPENGNGHHRDAGVDDEVERVHGQIRGIDVAAAASRDSLVPVEGDGPAKKADGEDVANCPEDADTHHAIAGEAEGARAGEDVRVEEEDGTADSGHGDSPEELNRNQELLTGMSSVKARTGEWRVGND